MTYTPSQWCSYMIYTFASVIYRQCAIFQNHFIILTGHVEQIILNRNECGLNDSWFVEHVAIMHDDSRKAHFPLARWLPPNKPMQFVMYDSQLPQVVQAKNPAMYAQRVLELQQKQEDFACEPLLNIVGMPRTVSLIAFFFFCFFFCAEVWVFSGKRS